MTGIMNRTTYLKAHAGDAPKLSLRFRVSAWLPTIHGKGCTMLSLRKPDTSRIRAFLEEQGERGLTYRAVGATATTPPPGYNVDRTRVLLGVGNAVFTAAKLALRQWRQFDLGWVSATSSTPPAPLVPGELVAIVARSVGIWWLNACRIVYVVDEPQQQVARFGFAYGTLPGHAGSGEERFLIEWDRANDNVWFDILAFSRPRHPLVFLGYPLVRWTQKRFGREASAAMRGAVISASPGNCIPGG